MKPTEFEEQNVVFAEDQPQYLSLPAHRVPGDPNGEVISCWELSDKEIELLKSSKRIYLSMWTFHNPLQPVRLTVENPLK